MARDLVFGLSFAVLVVSILLSVLVYNFIKSSKKTTRRKADDTGASSSSATSMGSDNYDVFLSFSGKDTRKTIVDHLYNGLVDAGIHVFRDDDELREGEKIGTNLLHAIKNSKISIPVLSRSYASSKWCLQELVEMTECMNSAGQVVLPIFYRVEPAHVRYQKESFGKSFSRLSRKYLEEDVAKWKKALQEVASLKGWESERTASGHEGELVKIVVRKVLSELKNAFQLVVAEQLVGIDYAVEDILRLLDDNPSATQIVGIHGMGGIGKTTLAKVVYNKLSSQFQHRSFIADIRESTQCKGMSCLQNQLIFDILKTNYQVSNTDEGIRIMESRFKCKKVLLLLDDVDDNNQIKALVGKQDWFETGSRIIITTRIRSILDDVNCKYELKEIAEDKSLILFSRHAFLRDSPPCEFESLSHAVVSTAGGLPLALEVVGSFLYGRNRGFWEDALKKLMEVPHAKVQEKLRISYDALNYEEQQIFLDIACFFFKSERLVASYMWEACNFLPNMGIETLSLRSLVKIDDIGFFRMHDQLRDLGREIVRQEDYNTPMNRSRVWIHEEALEVLQRNKGKEKDRVQALQCVGNHSQVELTTEQFETLPNLRVLYVNHANLIGDSKGLLPKLRILALIKCPASVVTSFHVEKLVVLYLYDCDMSELWEGWSRLQLANQLKFLALIDCHCLKVSPDFSTFQNLEILSFERCDNLEQVHSSIGQAKGLLSLNLSGCKKLQKLPQEMGNLEELEELYIGGTAIEEIPPCVVSSKKLKILFSPDCKSVVRLPNAINHLVNLWHLDLSGCSKLCRLPECIGSLVKLQHLSLKGVGIPEDPQCDHARFHIPNSIGKLESLTELDLSRSGICELPESIGDLKNLKILNIAHCEKLRSLPSTIAKLVSLELLDATECQGLGGEIHIDGLSSLKILRLSSTCISGLFDTFNKVSRLEKLEELDATNCQSLGGEIPIDRLSSLKILRLSSTCVSGLFGPFSRVSRLEKLEELDATNCKSLGGEIPIDRLPSLKILKLRSTSVSGFPDEFDKLSHLETLILCHCKMLLSLPKSISKLPSLQYLDLAKCDNLQSLPELPACLIALTVTCQHRTLPQLSHLIHLKALSVAGCRSLESMPELPLGILELFVQDCDELKELPSLSNLEFLIKLTIGSCSRLTEIKDLEALKSLTELSISRCGKLSNLDGLEHLQSLQYLDLARCDNFQALPELPDCLIALSVTCQHRTLPQLSHLIHLKGLSIVGCRSLEFMPELPSGILELFVQDCDELKELPSLSNLEFLIKFTIDSCSELTELKDLEALKSLTQLSISRCGKLSNLDGLEHLQSLKYLYLCMFFKSDDALCPVEDDIVQVRGLDRLKNLEEFQVWGCQSLVRPDLSQLTRLKELSLGECHNLVEINGLERLKGLETLDIVGCRSIEALPELSCFDNLKYLNIKGCSKL